MTDSVIDRVARAEPSWLSDYEERARIALGYEKDAVVEAAAIAAWGAYCRDTYGEYRADTDRQWNARARLWRYIAMSVLATAALETIHEQ